jgi:hypothetical protein
MKCLKCGQEERLTDDGLCRPCDEAEAESMWNAIRRQSPPAPGPTDVQERIANYVETRLTQLTTDQAALATFIDKLNSTGTGDGGRCGGCQKWRKIVAVGLCRDCNDELDATDYSYEEPY